MVSGVRVRNHAVPIPQPRPHRLDLVALPDDVTTDFRVLWAPKRDKSAATVTTNNTATQQSTTYSWTYQLQVDAGQEDPDLVHSFKLRTITLGYTETGAYTTLDGRKLGEPTIPPPLR